MPQPLKPGYSGPMVRNRRSQRSKKSAPQLELNPHSPRLEKKSPCSNENPAESIIKFKKNFFKCLWGHVPSEGLEEYVPFSLFLLLATIANRPSACRYTTPASASPHTACPLCHCVFSIRPRAHLTPMGSSPCHIGLRALPV